MMSALEVDAIAKRYGATVEGYGPYGDTFDVEVTSGYYFNTGFDNWTETPNHPLGWLIDHLNICYRFGCTTGESDIFSGYWLQEKVGADYWAWSVYCTAWLMFEEAESLPSVYGNGIRPVIEVSKSKFVN